MSNIIGFVGKKGVGKNFVADIVKEEVEKNDLVIVKTCALADPIKEYLEQILGISHKLLYGNDLGKEVFTEYVWDNVAEPIRTKFGNPSGRVTVRQAMQLFGTELNRDVWGKDIWTTVMERRIAQWSREALEPEDLWVLITDVRFPNEAEMVHRIGGKVWQVVGHQRIKDGKKKDMHGSEKFVDSIQGCDYVVRNDLEDTKDSLREQVRHNLGLMGHAARGR